MRKIGLNVGSGQRRFTSTAEVEWVNVDKLQRLDRPNHVPDLVCEGNNLPYGDGSVDYYVLHHCLEHEPQGGGGLIEEAYRVLKPEGSLLIFLPDIWALAVRWLAGGISDYIYIVNLMGAYIDDEADRHKWHYTVESLTETVAERGFTRYFPFDWRTIPGSDCARDWWIMAMEVKK